MDKTAALSSVSGITVTPVKLENDQIFRGNSVMQLGEGGAGQLSADGLTVQDSIPMNLKELPYRLVERVMVFSLMSKRALP